MINAGRLKVGDAVYLISDDVGVRRTRVESIELEGEGVNVARKGDDVGVVFKDRDLKSGLEVYVIRKKG